MATAENFLLVMTDPESGRPMIDSTKADAVFGGAFLLDLVAAGRLALVGQGRKARVTVVDAAPVADPVLQAAFERIREKKPQTPQNAVTRMGRKGRARTYEALAAQGSVRATDDKVLGIFPTTRHDVVDTARRDDLLGRIRASLLLGQPADAETGPVIGLLSAADLTNKVVDKPDRKKAKTRAKAISEGDWASEGVRKAIQAAQAAMTTAIATGAVAGTAGSS